ncbi:MAG: rhamnulokinase family protein [Candidatus Latescibacterota bacterium]|nr:rhamnulokinase family protein [Candidatus Latescibacterota bacterium]
MATSSVRNLLAFDLGAESGRAILGSFDGERLQLRELHRFPTGADSVLGRLYWNPLRLFAEMRVGLRAAAQSDLGQLSSIGIDTWGVDFALLSEDGSLLDNPRCYRDVRTEGMLDLALERVSREEIFECTGVQFLKINSLYQLLAVQAQQPEMLKQAHRLLMIPDLCNYYFTGRQIGEFSNATTTQFFDPRNNRWSTELLQRLGLPTEILPELLTPGSVVANLCREETDLAGLESSIPVVAPATHDTGSAVAAVPVSGDDDYAYLSSGTWSLMGVELAEPVVNNAALTANFTNEGGVASTYRFLKNIMGLWLVQECRRTWVEAGWSRSYEELTQMAASAPAFGPVVDADDERFLSPGDMPARVLQACRDSGQPEPADQGAIIRCLLESLALKYRWVLGRLEQILQRRLTRIHIVGGGIQNGLLCQLTADACRRPVIAGPAEATATGNLLVQAMALGWLESLAEVRAVVRTSFSPREYVPSGDSDRWDQSYEKLLALL